MFCVNRPTAISILLLALTATTAAQEVDARLTGGATSFVDFFNSSNYGTVGGSARFYFSKRWALEPEYLYMRASRNRSNSALWGNVNFSLLQPGSRINPYLFAGPGFLRGTFTSNTRLVNAGAGIRIFVTDRIFVSPQLRLAAWGEIFVEATGSIGFVLRK